MTNRTTEQAYAEYKKAADKLLVAALAFSPSREAPDGPGVLALPGLLTKLRAAADDLAAVQVDHAALPVKATAEDERVYMYQHPTERKQWNGHGPKPAWVEEVVAAGIPLESLRVV